MCKILINTGKEEQLDPQPGSLSEWEGFLLLPVAEWQALFVLASGHKKFWVGLRIIEVQKEIISIWL